MKVMKKMARWILLMLMILSCVSVYSQKKKHLKDDDLIAVEARKLLTEGWRPTGGGIGEASLYDTLYVTLSKKRNLQNERMTIEEGELMNRYIVCCASEENRNYNNAFSLAETKARADIANKLKKSDIMMYVQTITTSKNGDAYDRFFSVIVERSNMRLNGTEELWRMYKKSANGLYTAEVWLVFDKKEFCCDILNQLK